ncbi:MAG: 23S rRNA (uracil(1939)-C(5))-methyltransferase RlmD [candidate division Zixibacteria bacterium]|nr:23S rRNA (uracil(1939)-C(5))-methyltransferase RlmD [candidate division Zixibacteria bacterium]MBU1469096.1 23S rRNA (uracil(1939)-C(5))-methyltransferase RlmD [candidate division Zixibacteria bacterium]MBU2624618.1 23S rRNA (uracil(1939)-C(5))-methyltransferase RlmD [candidate division Zixibacteria bacterium]
MPTRISIGSEIEVTIDSMAFTGRGVGRVGDKVVFVTGGIPGDRLTARIVKKKRSFLEAVAIDIIEPSDDRIKAPCRHFDVCGGCSFQNVPYEKQLHYKQDFIRDALVRIGGEQNPPIKEIIRCQQEFYYRNKMEFSFLPIAGAPARLGLHVRGRWNEIFDVEECLLQSELSNEILAETKKLVNELEIPAYHISEHHGFIRFLVIRDSKQTGRIQVNIVTNKGDRPEIMKIVEVLRSKFDKIAAIYRTINSSQANVAAGEREELLWSDGDFFEIIGPHKFKVLPMTFLQTNTYQTEVLYNQTLRAADFSPDQNVLDLYCGCGTISHFISPLVKSVLGVELNEAAVWLAGENARMNGIFNCRFVAADAARYLTELKHQDAYFDRIVVDPPRAGIGNKVVRRLARLNPPVVVYVSCNPSTLARDVEQFREHGYRLMDAVPVDMFPHTFHVETVCRLERN